VVISVILSVLAGLLEDDKVIRDAVKIGVAIAKHSEITAL